MITGLLQGRCRTMLSETIRRTRQKAFLTQVEFAKELHVSTSTINRWETGKVKPNLSAMKNLKRFCEANGLLFDVLEREWLKDE